MPRMKVKGVSSMFGRFRVWFWHCPLCPNSPSMAFLSSSNCHDSARWHAARHRRCPKCRGLGLLPVRGGGAEPCVPCKTKGWV